MTRKIGHALHDILTAIDRIEKITRGRTLEDFEASWELSWLVGRGIEIISEASRAIPDHVQKHAAGNPMAKSSRHRQCDATRL